MKQIAFDPHLNTNTTEIVLVGCGGTGSALAKIIARMIYAMQSSGMRTPDKITFVDPDVVELKNVGRQAFAPADVGQYKAEILARRFSLALGLQIRAVTAPFSASTFESSYAYHHRNKLILGAVDNAAARHAISMVKNAVWIDAGNHRESGQVIIGNQSCMDVAELIDQIDAALEAASPEIRYLPNAAALFPALLEPEAVPEGEAQADTNLSCAELLLRNEQHLLINEQMALIAGQYLYKLLHRQPITSFMTYVDIESLVMRSVPINRANLETYLQTVEAAS